MIETSSRPHSAALGWCQPCPAIALPLFTLLCLLPLGGCSSEAPSGGDASSTGRTPAGQQVSPRASGSVRPASTQPGGPGQGRAYVRTASITPSPVVLSGPVSAVVEAFDPEGQAVTFERQWIVNGKPLPGQTGPSLAPENLKRGDTVSVKITPLDPDGAGEPYQTETVPVVNSPAVVTSIKFEPFPPRIGDQLVVHLEGSDPDGDEITFDLRWTRNGEKFDSYQERGLDLKEFKHGDEILLEVTPHDGFEPGEPQASETITVANTPPKFSSKPSTRLGRGRYEYQVAATDADGDPLTFGLESSPSGMTIDPKTGKLEWSFGPEVTGTHSVRVTVSDGQEDDPIWQDFELNVGGRAPQAGEDGSKGQEAEES